MHHTRVRNPDPATFDIHDRVNYAAEAQFPARRLRERVCSRSRSTSTPRSSDHGVLRDLPVADADVPPGRDVLDASSRSSSTEPGSSSEARSPAGQGRQENGPEAAQLPALGDHPRAARCRGVAVHAAEHEDHAGPRHPGWPVGHPDGASRTPKSPRHRATTWTAPSSSSATASTSSVPPRRASSARAATRSSSRCPASRTRGGAQDHRLDRPAASSSTCVSMPATQRLRGTRTSAGDRATPRAARSTARHVQADPDGSVVTGRARRRRAAHEQARRST